MDLNQIKAVVFDLEGTLFIELNLERNLSKSNMNDFMTT